MSKLFAFDSVESDKKDSLQHWNIKPRIFSGGYFGLAGLLFNRNIMTDLSVTYTSRYGSLMAFKSQDLEDSQSAVNYMFAGYFKALRITNRFYVTPFAGYYTPQTDRPIEKDGSSAIFSLTGTYSFGRFTLDNTVIGSNLTNKSGAETMINRLEIRYRNSYMSVSAFTWYSRYNISTGGYGEYLTGSAEVNFHELRVSEKLKLNCGVTAYRYFKGSDSEALPRGGLIFSLSLPIIF
jgi:hypothetical protein